MAEVVSSIKRVTDIMGEISAASSEQSAGVAQVGAAVTQMDQSTQQNAALVEQSAAAAESLKHQAQQLVRAVAVFKLSASGAAMAVPAAGDPVAAPTPGFGGGGAERRGPNRASNIERLSHRPTARAEKPAQDDAEFPRATGTNGEWTSI